MRSFSVLERVKLLLNCGADVNVVNDQKESPLYILLKCTDWSSTHSILPNLTKEDNPNVAEDVPLVVNAPRHDDIATKSHLDNAAADYKTNGGAMMAALKASFRSGTGVLYSVYCNLLTFDKYMALVFVS